MSLRFAEKDRGIDCKVQFFGFQVAGFRRWVPGVEFGCWISGVRFQVSGLEFRVSASSFGFRVSGSGLQISGFETQGTGVGRDSEQENAPDLTIDVHASGYGIAYGSALRNAGIRVVPKSGRPSTQDSSRAIPTMLLEPLDRFWSHFWEYLSPQIDNIFS